jgi:hypothetical protein
MEGFCVIMGIMVIEKLAELRQHVGIDGLSILEELTLLMAPYNYRAAYDTLLSIDPESDPESFSSALRVTEIALIDHYNPVPGTENSAKTDIKRFFNIAREAVRRKDWSGLSEHLTIFPHIFDPAGKSVCGQIRSICSNIECGQKFYDSEATYCEYCNTIRGMCRNHLGASGVETRCRFHKNGRATLMGLTGRAKMYAAVMSDVDRTIFEDGVLSSDLDMTAEIALIARRITGLVDGVKVNPKDMARAIRKRTAVVKKAADELTQVDPLESEQAEMSFLSKYRTFIESVDSLLTALDTAAEDDSRWREIVGTVNQLRPVIKEQRETIVQERQMITAEKMRELIALATAQFRGAIMDSSKDAMAHVVGRMQDLGSAEFSRMLEAEILTNDDFAEGSFLARRILAETQKRIAADRQLQKRVK